MMDIAIGGTIRSKGKTRTLPKNYFGKYLGLSCRFVVGLVFDRL